MAAHLLRVGDEFSADDGRSWYSVVTTNQTSDHLVIRVKDMGGRTDVMRIATCSHVMVRDPGFDDYSGAFSD